MNPLDLAEVPMSGGRPMYWKLVNAKPEPATRGDMIELFEHPERRRIGKDTVGEAEVSTVFLVIDHAFGDPGPVLFETMIFGGPYSDRQWRYRTAHAALAGHHRIVRALRAGKEPI